MTTQNAWLLSRERLQRAGSKTRLATLFLTKGQGSAAEARRHLEILLRREAAQRDELLFAERRLKARSQPSAYLRALVGDDAALRTWATLRVKRYLHIEASVRLQTYWRCARKRSMGEEATAWEVRQHVVLARLHVRRELAEIQTMREEVRESAHSFFEKTAPPLAKRIFHMRRRLTQVSSGSGKGSHAHRQVVTAAKTLQEDILKQSQKLESLEEQMVELACHRR